MRLRHQALNRVFTAPENQVLRKAHQIVKAYPNLLDITPVQIGGDDVSQDSDKAYQQLQELAAQQRRRAPWLTVAQAFSRVFEDPTNGELARAAHLRPAPTTSYAFPR